jgi:hypothetical protein
VEEVVNGSVTKLTADDPGALAQRLSILEARLGVVEAALSLDTEPEAEPASVQRGSVLAPLALSLLILVLGAYWLAISAHPEILLQQNAAILNVLCYVHHGLPVKTPCTW